MIDRSSSPPFTGPRFIVGMPLRELGYACDYAGEPVRLGKLQSRCLQALDGLNLLLFSARERGPLGALRFVSRYFVISGNRQKPKTD